MPLPFPFTDLSAIKRRPAVLLSTNSYNSRRLDIMVVPITSNVAGRQPEDYLLSDWARAGLPKPSVVKCVLGTVEQNQVIRRLGALTAADLRQVEAMIAAALGLPKPP